MLTASFIIFFLFLKTFVFVLGGNLFLILSLVVSALFATRCVWTLDFTTDQNDNDRLDCHFALLCRSFRSLGSGMFFCRFRGQPVCLFLLLRPLLSDCSSGLKGF